jgi:hypothetical protein
MSTPTRIIIIETTDPATAAAALSRLILATPAPPPAGQTAPAGQATAHETTHTHHWILDTPNGPTSTGRCDCGAAKEFRNSHDDDATPAPGQGKRTCSACNADVRSNIHRRQCLNKAV